MWARSADSRRHPELSGPSLLPATRHPRHGGLDRLERSGLSDGRIGRDRQRHTGRLELAERIEPLARCADRLLDALAPVEVVLGLVHRTDAGCRHAPDLLRCRQPAVLDAVAGIVVRVLGERCLDRRSTISITVGDCAWVAVCRPSGVRPADELGVLGGLMVELPGAAGVASNTSALSSTGSVGVAGDPCRTGQLYHEPAEYAELIRRAHAAGLQTATHAQSPTAIEMVVSAIEAALAEHPDDDARHRIEHCGLPTPEQIRRMAAAGIRPVNQTQHYFNWGEGVEQAIGTPGERFNPLGEFEAAGVAFTISSDAPVAEPIPLEAIQTAVTRVTRRGHKLGPDSLRVSADAALRAHTYEGAVSLGREDDLGSLEAGKYADFVVLGGDPLSVDASEISQIPVLETWVGGERRYAAARREALVG